jgi:hypothetical protein
MAGDQIDSDFVFIGRSNQGRTLVKRGEFSDALLDPMKDEQHFSTFCQAFLRHETLFLNGEQRIHLVNPQPAGDLRNPSPAASLQVLFTDDLKRREVRRIGFSRGYRRGRDCRCGSQPAPTRLLARSGLVEAVLSGFGRGG